MKAIEIKQTIFRRNMPLRNLLCRTAFLLTGLIVTVNAGTPALRAAPIIAAFTGGGSAADPVTDQVDAFSGMAGDGWISPWGRRGKPSTNGNIPDAAVLSPGGIWAANHLQVTPKTAANGTKATGGVVYRDFGAQARFGDVPYTVSFLFSIDTIGSFLDSDGNTFYLFGDSNQKATPSLNYTDGSTAWVIMGKVTDGIGMWGVYQRGGTFESSEILLEQGVLYSFQIMVNPTARQYSVSISNGTQSYQSESMLFYRDEDPVDATGDRLLFAANYLEDQGPVFSVGDISIQAIPEPSTALLVLTLGGVGLVGRRWLRK